MGLFGFGKKKVQTYKLVDHYGRAKYIGTTNDLRSRATEHRESGKRFSRIVPTSGFLPRREAERREARNISSFRRATGSRPAYNKTSDGRFKKWF